MQHASSIPVLLLALLAALTRGDESQPQPPSQSVSDHVQVRLSATPSFDDYEEEKRAWRELSSSWGKRGWQDLQSSGWGKRGWQDLQSPGWGKRGWQDLQSSGWGKRGWKDMPSQGWGKRGWKDLNSSWGKRGWQDLQGSWGKRDVDYVEDEDNNVDAKRAWGNLRGTWGKRSPDWDILGLFHLMFSKRLPSRRERRQIPTAEEEVESNDRHLDGNSVHPNHVGSNSRKSSEPDENKPNNDTKPHITRVPLTRIPLTIPPRPDARKQHHTVKSWEPIPSWAFTSPPFRQPDENKPNNDTKPHITRVPLTRIPLTIPSRPDEKELHNNTKPWIRVPSWPLSPRPEHPTTEEPNKYLSDWKNLECFPFGCQRDKSVPYQNKPKNQETVQNTIGKLNKTVIAHLRHTRCFLFGDCLNNPSASLPYEKQGRIWANITREGALDSDQDPYRKERTVWANITRQNGLDSDQGESLE